jgi:hypothetical protein
MVKINFYLLCCVEANEIMGKHFETLLDNVEHSNKFDLPQLWLLELHLLYNRTK